MVVVDVIPQVPGLRHRSQQPQMVKYLSALVIFATAAAVTAASGSARATPLQLFPFSPTPATQSAPPVSEDGSAVAEMPARLQRQTVSYATRESPGTIIIDTPNTYLYYVLGGGQAVRYGIGVGRD